jgi:FkbM family methyltransferase
MTSSEYISNLYRLLLGRPPDEEGLRFWLDFVERSGDPIEVFSRMLNSPEYLNRHTAVTTGCAPETIAALAAELPHGRLLTVVDVGAQMLPHESHVYLPLLNANMVSRVVGFDPLAHRIVERVSKETGHNQQLLPYAIGDGRQHTLYVNNVDATSSLYRLNEEVTRQFVDMSSLITVEEQKVQTHTLDEVVTCDKIDFLKLDIQGFELRGLESAHKTLPRTAVIHCETEFRQIYEGQPLFPQVHEFLINHGFIFVDLYQPVNLSMNVPSGRGGKGMLIFSDSVFFRDPDPDDAELHIVQALISILVYNNRSLAEWLLHQHDMATGTRLASIFAT